MSPEIESLKHYAWLIHCADLYIGGDTGPMHIAAAMGTPVVAVFGGTDPVQHATVRVPAEILRADKSSGRDAKERLRSITPEVVYDACVRLARPRKD